MLNEELPGADPELSNLRAAQTREVEVMTTANGIT